jgi:2'-5' RNA ligase
MEDESPLILTLRLDEASHLFFDELRERHFPRERNFLKAHLTLFHKLPDTAATVGVIKSLTLAPFEMRVTGLINLGAGVAYRLESLELSLLHKALSTKFSDNLSAQDKQGFRGHITIQNKTSPVVAKALLTELANEFEPFTVYALGLDLWRYLGGPWAHKDYFPFT